MYIVLLRSAPQGTSTNMHAAHNLTFFGHNLILRSLGAGWQNKFGTCPYGINIYIFRCIHRREKHVDVWIIARTLSFFKNYSRRTTRVSKAIDLISEVNRWPSVMILTAFSCQTIAFGPFCCIMCFHVSPLDVLPINYVQICSKKWLFVANMRRFESISRPLNIVLFRYFVFGVHQIEQIMRKTTLTQNFKTCPKKGTLKFIHTST